MLILYYFVCCYNLWENNLYLGDKNMLYNVYYKVWKLDCF